MILSVLLTRSFGRSMAEMIGVAEAIGGGHYERRLREYPGREFSGLAKAINRMAVSIAEQVRTITDQKRELEAVLDGMREGVMVLDADGRISQVNTALKRIVGSMRDMEGQRPMDLVLSPELQRACDGVLAPDAGDGPRWLQIEPQKGRVYDVTIVGLDERGANLGAVVVFHDISELKRLERVRRDFVANVSHELRTPLTTIKGYAETLIDNKLAGGGTAESFLGIILRNADRMVKMVEDLLSLSRLEAREESFTPRDVDARGALAEALRICVPLAERVGVSLEPRLPEAGLRVWADFDLLMQVFRNLLENAVRYSPSGEAVIVDGATDAEGFVHFMVSDRGPGIPAEDRDRIFERFYRVEKHRMRSGSGSTGLGLAICRHIVERHGGRIWVEPRTDEKGGSIFHFTLATPPEVLDGDSSQETGNHNA
nr:ATP-binding protein [Desulfobaculum xiamenense]